RAHRALELLAALADPVAHLHGGGEASLPREVEKRLGLPRLVGSAVAQVLGHRRALDDVARVHPVVGIERALELAEGLHQCRAVHALEERAARAAVAVLARD